MVVYFLRAFAKPLVLIALVGAIFFAGGEQARKACESANLKAQNTELLRQINASKNVMKKANLESATRENAIEILTQKVREYELDENILANDSCILSDSDAERLLLIK